MRVVDEDEFAPFGLGQAAEEGRVAFLVFGFGHGGGGDGGGDGVRAEGVHAVVEGRGHGGGGGGGGGGVGGRVGGVAVEDLALAGGVGGGAGEAVGHVGVMMAIVGVTVGCKTEDGFILAPVYTKCMYSKKQPGPVKNIIQRSLVTTWT